MAKWIEIEPCVFALHLTEDEERALMQKYNKRPDKWIAEILKQFAHESSAHQRG
jgi:hypothetical protein